MSESHCHDSKCLKPSVSSGIPEQSGVIKVTEVLVLISLFGFLNPMKKKQMSELCDLQSICLSPAGMASLTARTPALIHLLLATGVTLNPP